MTEYIEREAAVELFQNAQFEYTAEEAAEFVSRIPAADVRPVVHGEWIDVRYDDDELVCGWYTIPKCSVCEEESPYKSNFCPICGADMREES